MKLIIIAAFAIMNLCACFGADELQFEGKSMSVWLSNLEGIPRNGGERFPSKETQQLAVQAFQRMGGREYNYPVDSLNPNAERKLSYEGIMLAFKVGGANATPAIPKLIALFNQDDIKLVRLAAQCLVGIGTNSVGPLMDALSAKNVKTRIGAVLALGQIGPPAKPAVPLMLDKLKTEEPQVRLQVIATLGLIHQYPERVIPVLISNLQSDNPKMRGNAAFAILFFRKDIEAAAPILFKLLNDADGRVRNNAVGVLKEMDLGKEYIPQLISNASNSDGTVRCLIAQALGKQMAYTNQVFPVLLKSTKDPDRYVRESAGVTLNKMGYKPPINITAIRGNP